MHKANLINKLSVYLKECHETEFWIDLLNATDFIEAKTALSMKEDLKELLKMLTASINTSKKSLPSKK